ncbi:PREDICTED: protein RALF-like 12 [Nelumbo nucifera]|uniref:Protein RALF-like 12 n=2 Tax=Nelumbo nucifera TaxID=4432 RepID=A0A1U7Z5I9_NELNU|nr:PREDICTED: protein RALF-like 12 [Nelumbo nucifera]DAD24138.1 TPA_asm: hypothetical protein HUJ06_025601 [Nelumbo nucifera]
MEMSRVKACMLLVFLISTMWMNEQVEAKLLNIDPCKGPNPPPHCLPPGTDPKSPPQQANTYNRGCSKIFRCRGN